MVEIAANNSSGIFSVADVQALLEVVNDLFEEQTDLEKIVRKIMHRAQTLLKCERCSVQLLEDIESPVLFFCLLSHCVCLSVFTFVHLNVCSFCLSQFSSKILYSTIYFYIFQVNNSFHFKSLRW